MTENDNRQSGFALVLVMMALAMAVVLGLSYLSSASVKRASSDNLILAGRARYLAESGLHHALYLLRNTPEALDAVSAAHPLGPFHADETSDTYVLYAEKADSRNYLVTAEGRSGGVKQKCSAHVYRTSGPEARINQAVLLDGGSAWLPPTLTVNGSLHANGGLYILSTVHGDVSATGLVSDPVHRVTGLIGSYADRVDAPAITYSDYTNYRLSGESFSAASQKADTFAADDPLAGGGAVTPANPGGVVRIDAENGYTVSLSENLNFRGTLVVKGNLILGKNVTLTAEDGFPALVVSGKVYVAHDTDATINGLVVADGGIATHGSGHASRTVINGGLLCRERVYDLTLRGQHQLSYDADRCRIYDVKDPAGQPTVELVTWND